MPGARPLNVLDVCQVVPLRLYSKVPIPVAFTTIVPVDTAQSGCVTAGELTVGIAGTGLITTEFPLYAVIHVGLL